MPGTKLDLIDRRILDELQSDGRMTNVELSRRVGISAPPCLRRVRALEEMRRERSQRQARVGRVQLDISEGQRSGMLVACHHGLSETDLAYVHDRFRDFAGQW